MLVPHSTPPSCQYRLLYIESHTFLFYDSQLYLASSTCCICYCCFESILEVLAAKLGLRIYYQVLNVASMNEKSGWNQYLLCVKRSSVCMFCCKWFCWFFRALWSYNWATFLIFQRKMPCIHLDLIANPILQMWLTISISKLRLLVLRPH